MTRKKGSKARGELLRMFEAADLAGVSNQAIDKAIRAGRLKATLVAGLRCVRRAELDRFIAARQQSAQAAAANKPADCQEGEDHAG